MTLRSLTVRWIESERARIVAGWVDGLAGWVTWGRRRGR